MIGLGVVIASLVSAMATYLIVMGMTPIVPRGPVVLTAVLINLGLVAAMVAIMLPYCVMICLVAILGAVATVHEKFTAQSLNPIVLNLVTAAGAALSVLVMTRGYPVEQRIFWVAVSVLVAGALQVAQMAYSVNRAGVRLRPTTVGVAWRAAGVSALLGTFLPIMLSSSAVQINTFLDAGAFKVRQDGTFTVDAARMTEAVTALTGEILAIEAEGNYAKAKELSERLGVVRPEVQKVLDKLAGVPVDIEPKFTTAAQLVAR